MISKDAVNIFLKRKLNSFDWMKELSERELDRVIDTLEPKPFFHTKCYKHQKTCFLIGIYNLSFLYLLDMGLGKTKIMLDLVSYLKMKEKVRKTLIVVPNLVNIESWCEEIRIHSPHLKMVPLIGHTLSRRHAIKQDADLFIINYQGLVYLCTSNVHRKKKREINRDKIQLVIDQFDGLIIDESQKCKSMKTLNYKVCDRIGAYCKVRFALTGTPFGRDPHDLWSQFHIIDRGETLGKFVGIFRQIFFNTIINPWGGYEHKFDRNKEVTLHDMIQNKSIRYKSEECMDLPEQVFIRTRVQFDKNAEEYYNHIVDKIVKSERNITLMDNAFINMRELCSGFIMYKDENEERQTLEFDNPKLEALIGLVEQIPINRKAVIFHEFIYSGNKIEEELKKLKYGTARLWSGAKDPAEELRRFQKDPECRIFIVNHRSGSEGINLQVANYEIFFETPLSPIVRLQAEARCRRPSQQAKKIFYYDIVVKNSIEEKILYYLKEGRDLFQALIEGKESWK